MYSVKRKSEMSGAGKSSLYRLPLSAFRKQKSVHSEHVEVCLERARAEMKAYEQYKNEPRVIQRARAFETYLRDKTISFKMMS